MTNLDRTGIVADAGVARRIGELLCDALYGDLSRQEPLAVIDRESYWRVEGNWNRDGIIEGPAEFFLSVDKSDGRITDLGELMRYAPHSSVLPIINEHFARTKIDETTVAKETWRKRSENDQVDPDRSAAGMLILINLARGGVIFSGDLAVKIGEVLCDAHYGDLPRQLPLRVLDKDTYWRIEGNWNRDRQAEGQGPFFLSINKFDGRVIEIGE
jgi:hypothetical protein